jgi:hypothetical protein
MSATEYLESLAAPEDFISNPKSRKQSKKK